MDFYNFNKDTGEFTGVEQGFPNPKRPDEFLKPANSTEIEPPKTGANKVAVWNGEKWASKADYRGEVYYLADSIDPIKISAIGEEKPQNALDAPPDLRELDAVKVELQALRSYRAKSSNDILSAQYAGLEAEVFSAQGPDAIKFMAAYDADDQVANQITNFPTLVGEVAGLDNEAALLEIAAIAEKAQLALGFKRFAKDLRREAEGAISVCETLEQCDALAERIQAEADIIDERLKQVAKREMTPEIATFFGLEYDG